MFAIAALLFSAVSAHASLVPAVSSTSSYAFNLRVPHGCNTTNTIAVTLQIPNGVTSVKPKKTAGWTLSIARRIATTPITLENGTVVTTEVDAVTWSGGSLPDDEYEEFGVSLKLPFPQTDGHKFYFPVVQQCVVGWNNWTQLPSATTPSPRYPAPAMSIFANGTLIKFNATATNALLGSFRSAEQKTNKVNMLLCVSALCLLIF